MLVVQGSLEAQGTLIAWLDDDATAEPGWLENFWACCTDSMVLGVGGTVKPRWESTRPGWFPEEFYWVLGCSYQAAPPHPVEVRNLWAGCMCVKREVFEAVGGFRSDIGHVGQYVLGRRGNRVLYSCQATLSHNKSFFMSHRSASIILFPHDVLHGTISSHAVMLRGFQRPSSRATLEQKIVYPANVTIRSRRSL